jgi:streptomycin 6-kinase
LRKDQFEFREEVLGALAKQGRAGQAWLEELPDLLGRLERDWGVIVGAQFPNATEAFAAEAVTADGTPVALKIAVPGVAKAAREAALLGAMDGRGYVRLLRHDRASNAMLLERLGPQLAALDLPLEKQFTVICETLTSAWRPLPDDLSLPTGADKAQAMAAYIGAMWRALKNPCSEKLRDVALCFANARCRAFDPSRAVVGHGDPHAWNTLQNPEGGFKFVDPDGFLIEPAHDVSIMMREWSEPFLNWGCRRRGAQALQIAGAACRR